jgi:hypothetical protein
VVRESLAGAGARDARPRDPLEHADDEAVAQVGQPRCLRWPLHSQEIGRHAHARDGRQILGSRPLTRLLSSTQDLRHDPNRRTDPEGPRPGRAIHIIGGDGQKVNATLVDEERNPTDGANGIDVQGHPAPATYPPDLADRLDRADFSIGRHDRDESRVRSDRPGDGRGINPPFGVHPEVRNRVPTLLQISTGVQHGEVLDGGGHDVTSWCVLRRASDGEVVGLSGARGEDDASGGGADEPCDLRAGSLDRRARLDPEGVRCCRVAYAALEKGAHDR